jgi:hypothetical protein
MDNLQLICITGFGVFKKEAKYGFLINGGFFSMRNLVRDKNKN